MKRYKPMGKKPDKIFAKLDQASEAARIEAEERLGKELEEIGVLANHAVFRSWLKRIVRKQGGILASAIRDEAGQAQSLTLYFIAKDLCRAEAGKTLVLEIVGDHFGEPQKGKGK